MSTVHPLALTYICTICYFGETFFFGGGGGGGRGKVYHNMYQLGFNAGLKGYKLRQHNKHIDVNIELLTL